MAEENGEATRLECLKLAEAWASGVQASGFSYPSDFEIVEVASRYQAYVAANAVHRAATPQ